MSTSTKPTGGFGISSGWDVLFQVRFTLSKSAMHDSKSDVLAFGTAWVARHLEKDEDKVVAHKMEAKKRGKK